MADPTGGSLFVESQPMHQNVLLRVLMPVSMVTTSAVVLAVAAATPPAQRISLYWVLAAILGFEIGLLFQMGVRVRVREGVVRAAFSPLFPWTRVIPVDRIESLERVKYDAMRDCGGWGLKSSKKYGLAFVVSGDQAVHMTYEGGRKILLGSRRADELADAIRSERARLYPGLTPL